MSGALNVGELFFQLGIEDTKLKSGLRDASGTMRRFSDDASRGLKGVGDAGRRIDDGISVGVRGAGRDLDRLERHAKTTSGGISKHFKRLKGGIAAGIAAGAAGIGLGLIELGKQSVKAYSDAEQSQTRLEQAYKKFPKIHDVSLASLRKMNAALQSKTIYDDDDLAAMQAKLAVYNLTGKQIKDVTPLVADFASATGRDVVGAGGLIGKAMLGNARALKDVGIKYKATGNAAKDFAVIYDKLQKKLGGDAAAQGKTGAGQLIIFQHQIDEIKESIGKQLMPFLKKAVDELGRFMPKIQAAIEKYGPKIAAWFKENWPSMKEGLKAFGEIATGVIKVVAILARAFNRLPKPVKDFTFVALMAGTPVAILKAGMGGLKKIVSSVASAFRSVVSAVKSAGKAFTNFWEGIMKWVDKAMQKLGSFFEMVGRIKIPGFTNPLAGFTMPELRKETPMAYRPATTKRPAGSGRSPNAVDRATPRARTASGITVQNMTVKAVDASTFESLARQRLAFSALKGGG